MPTYSLVAHPDHPAPAGLGVEVDLEAAGRGLRLTYRLRGDTADVAIPPRIDGGRRDELWKRTCFEAFVGAGEGPAYVELNMAPAGEWAAYAFDGYRTGMRPLHDAGGPTMLQEAPWPAGRGEAEWSFHTEDLPDPALDWRVGLATVIETVDGSRSFWALAHPSGPPDFHDPACFVLLLPSPRFP